MSQVSPFYIPRPDRLYERLRLRQRQSTIDPATAEDILAEYGLRLLAKPQAPAGQGSSQSLVVRTDGGTKLLKEYRPTVTEPAIRHEHSILARLAQVGFSAPRLVTTPAGETLVSRNGHNYVVFEFIEGGFRYYDYFLLPGQLRQLINAAGETLAMLHSELESLDPRGYNLNGFRSRHEGRWQGLDWYASRLASCMQETQQWNGSADQRQDACLLPYAGYLQESLYRLDAGLEKAGLPRLVIHGDYGPHNLLFRRDKPFIVLDFESARLDWRAVDLAIALWRFGSTRSAFDFDRMKCFLDAYRARFPVASDELQLLPDVWIFLHVRRCIGRWHSYRETRDAQRLAEASRFLGLATWMTDNRETFLARLVQVGAP